MTTLSTRELIFTGLFSVTLGLMIARGNGIIPKIVAAPFLFGGVVAVQGIKENASINDDY